MLSWSSYIMIFCFPLWNWLVRLATLYCFLANFIVSASAGPDKEIKYVILGEKAKMQLIRDSRKDIDFCMTELQKNPLNYTQVFFYVLFFLPLSIIPARKLWNIRLLDLACSHVFSFCYSPLDEMDLFRCFASDRSYTHMWMWLN